MRGKLADFTPTQLRIATEVQEKQQQIAIADLVRREKEESK